MTDLTAIPQSQQRVASLVASGLMDKEIARDLGISPGAVKDRVERLLRYAGVRNRVQLTVWWLRQTGQLRETVQ
ncbi:LuxR C-terminal-related transcriptional regulator [Azospirillum argentinense]|uniref:LuxR C-terminal-related transcriptional regulator n=1 Tax=Azospirillum argentinense TaxID=2970906 RepID=A0ABW8VAQ9_9PROT